MYLEKLLAEYQLATQHGFKVIAIRINPNLAAPIKNEMFLFITGVKFEVKVTGEMYLWDVLVILDENVPDFKLEVASKITEV